MIAAAVAMQVAIVSPPATIPTGGRLAPPLDRALRYRVEQVRTVGDRERRFVIERRVVFHRDGNGLRAEMVLATIEPVPTDGVSRRFAAAAGALGGRTLVFHLDAIGHVVAVDEADAVWKALVDGVSATAARRSQPVAAANDPAAALRALPPAARLAVIASALTPLIATRDAVAAPATRPVTLPGTTVGGTPMPLTGTRTVTRPAPDRVVVAITAADDDAANPVRVERHRVVDATTELLIDETETTQTGAAGMVQRITSHTSLTPW